jgi:hypothetical protein
VAGGWRRPHNEELYNLNASPNVIRMIKSRRMKWAGHVACIEGIRNSYAFWLENMKERNHSENLGIDGKIILEYILGKYLLTYLLHVA